MKNKHSFFLESRVVSLAGEAIPKGPEVQQSGRMEGADADTRGADASKRADQRLEGAAALSARPNDEKVTEKIRDIKTPTTTAEAAPIYDTWVKSVRNQIDSFKVIEERFNSGGQKDVATKRKLIAAVEAAGGTVSDIEYLPKPSNTLFDDAGSNVKGYGSVIADLEANDTNHLQAMVTIASDGYEWKKFRRQMVALNMRMQAAKEAYNSAT